MSARDSSDQNSKVLVVDDQGSSQILLTRMLADLGADLFRVGSGERALELMQKHRFAVVLLDVEMAGMNGIETAQAMRAQEATRYVPLIFVTGLEDDRSSRFEGYDAGAVDYLFKPVEREVLRSKVRVFLELDRNKRALEAALRRLADANRQLARLGVIDPLTGLYNRRGLEAELQRQLMVARRVGAGLTACIINCENFRAINSAYGHGAGDMVLRTVARRIEGALRASDTLGRIGGDEFLALFPQTRLAQAHVLAEQARLSVGTGPILLAPGSVEVRVRIGVASLPWDTSSLAELVARTRLALQDSRALDGPREDGDEVSELFRDLMLGTGLRAVGQPIIDLEDEHIEGYELLARGPRGPLSKPYQFLQLAREQHVLTMIDLQCLKTCLTAAAGLPADMQVHVNVFPTTLLDVSIEELQQLFAVDRGARVCVELSEEQFVGDPEELVERIAALREVGVAIAVDDVGKGTGTLDSVILLEPDVVKIDRDLVHGAFEDMRKERLLRRLVSLSDVLGCELVAEGVEDPRDATLLRAIGIRRAQGFLWSRPRELEDLRAVKRVLI